MTTILATRISVEELEHFMEAQKANPILVKVRELSVADLSRRGMQVSPQRILDRVVDDEQLMMVLHELQ